MYVHIFTHTRYYGNQCQMLPISFACTTSNNNKNIRLRLSVCLVVFFSTCSVQKQFKSNINRKTDTHIATQIRIYAKLRKAPHITTTREPLSELHTNTSMYVSAYIVCACVCLYIFVGEGNDGLFNRNLKKIKRRGKKKTVPIKVLKFNIVFFYCCPINLGGKQSRELY